MRIYLYAWAYDSFPAPPKAGSEKPTTSVFVACAAAAQGREVLLLDADPQGSASSWSDRAEHRGTPLPFPVVPVGATDLAAIAARGSAGLVVVDTPPGAAVVIDAAVDAADLVVIPSGAAPADIDRVWPTLDLTTHRPTAILLTAVDLRTVLASGVPEHLAAQGAPVLRTVVRRRQAITEAFGTLRSACGITPMCTPNSWPRPRKARA
jgi:chromosome partitioning protein